MKYVFQSITDSPTQRIGEAFGALGKIGNARIYPGCSAIKVIGHNIGSNISRLTEVRAVVGKASL